MHNGPVGPVGPVRASTRGRIYVLDGSGKPRAVAVRLGITDGSSTELLLRPDAAASSELKEGVQVLVGLPTAFKVGAKPVPHTPPMRF
jgi:HlyD family secretion protein